ncbi:ligand-binding sensor domain-containing protein [Thalassotalea profundi]|uniref:GGDEF domain-containing protein n=1 Tax=Thalassotalea profundi TaxID=2036687 RepID=A0ABQ3IN13_9GAMM|nr:two-component regulator propeller domain-containing protein [Thalassotalea profundi]GHE89222.1 hypothetical protein GCM10011501_18400 [Thalassotalea profundi]
MFDKIKIHFAFIVSVLLFLMTLPSNCLAMNASISFQHLTIEDGLPQNSVLAIAQDNSGFIWFGTEDGLARYDGYSLKVFKHEINNVNSLSHNYVSIITKDSKGNLWIGTRGGGLNYFNTKTEQFTRFHHQANNPNSISNNSIYTIIEDSKQNLWIGTLGGGLNYFDIKNQKFTHYRHQTNTPNSLSNDTVYSIVEDKRGDFWIGTFNGLNYLNHKTGKFTHYQHQTDNTNSLSHNTVYSLLEDNQGNFWIGTGNGGLNYLDTKSNQFTHYRHQTNDLTTLSDDTVFSLLKDKQNNLWIGTGDGGLNHFNSKDKQFTHYRHQANHPNSLSHDTVYTLLEDHQNNLWVGTVGGGINRFNMKKKLFTHFHHQPNNPNSLTHNNVFSIEEDNQGGVWIGTRGGGLNYLDNNNQKFTHYRSKVNSLSGLNDHSIYALKSDSKNNLWIGTGSGGLNYLDRKTGKFSHFKHQPDNPNSLSHNTIYSIVEDSHKNLWIGTQSGLNYFDIKNGKFTRYYHQADNPNSLSHDTIYIMTKDKDGNLWIGTPNALNHFNTQTKKFTHYKHQENNPSSLSYNTVYSMTTDSQGNIWIGTDGGGLNVFNIKAASFKNYNIEHGLFNNVIYGIEEDNQGHIWVSTNKGLSRLDPNTEVFINYDIGDGLQSNEFNIGASFKGKSGNLYFGGINGFNQFSPEKIAYDVTPLNVVITDILLLNQPVPILRPTQQEATGKRSDFNLEQVIHKTKSITLDYQDNVVSFEFSALNFSNPKKINFSYQLIGWDKDWINTDYKNRRATYTNLPDGDYIFRVKASNANGFWDVEGTSLNITVLAPPWRTWWAYTLYVLFILSLIIAFINSQRKKVLFEQHLNAQLENKVILRTKELQLANEHLEEANSKLEELSSTDQLTGLKNRRFLKNHLQNDIDLILRKHKSKNQEDKLSNDSDLIFFLIDLDYFKKINDVHGHSAGDAVLIQIKAILESVFRETDYLVRWGGEEFLVIARFTNRIKAPFLSERLRLAIEEHKFDINQEAPLSKTCSIGYACFPFIIDNPNLLSWERVIDIADHCLYAAKKSSRNAWVGLENLALNDEHIMSKIIEETQHSIDIKELEVISSLSDNSLIKWQVNKHSI